MLKRVFASLTVGLWLHGSAYAAPLFPDVRDDHWAKDAVAALAAKGLVEGYPDGTFKGDRACSRWEVAMIVARLLAQMEAAHATFATKAELEDLRKLALALREELAALGVRVTNLEENTSRLDKRVTELERITFYGSLQARVGYQSFSNQGSWGITRPGAPFISYDDAIGSVLGVGGGLPAAGGVGLQRDLNQFNFGILPVADYALGRPLTDGSIMAAVARLGVKANLTEDFEARVEFAAYTSQGSGFNDAYWGVTAPWLLNNFTGSAPEGFDPQSQTHRPFTSMVLDNFWILHKPSGTSLTIGSFPDSRYDDLIYVAPENTNAYGSAPYFFINEGGRFPSFGIQAIGESALGENDEFLLRWEAMGVKLPSGLPPAAGPGVPNAFSYSTHAEGANLALLFHDKRGKVRLNFLHAGDDDRNTSPLRVGGIQGVSPVMNWVNPNGFFVNQLGGRGSMTAGLGSTSDARPLVPFNTSQGLPVDPTTAAGPNNFGGIGPQSQTMLGASGDYVFDNEFRPRVFGEYAHTDYTPNRNSGYVVGGNAFRLGGSASFVDTVDLEVSYLSVDATYDPYVLGYPLLQGTPLVLLRLPSRHQATMLYSLHNTEKYPHNREGFRTKLEYHFLDTGEARFEYGRLNQKTASVYNVQVGANAFGPGTPTQTVLGFSPGFQDFGFGPLATDTFSIRGLNTPNGPVRGVQEAPLGLVTELTLGASYKWWLDDEQVRGVKLSGIFVDYDFFRQTRMDALTNKSPEGLRAANINYMDFNLGGFFLAVNYDLTDWVRINASFSQLYQRGHYDRVGINGDWAVFTGNPRFTNLDTVQKIPALGFDLQVTEDVDFGIEGRLFDTVDLVDPATITVPATNLGTGPALGVHPYSWRGWQVLSDITVNF